MSGNDYSPPPGPPPSHRTAAGESQPTQSHGDAHVSFASASGRSSELQSNNPWRNAHNSASQGPPQYEEEYARPPGPPPSHPKSDDPEPPPYDPWLAVPDNALLPPPPGFHEDRSPTANASEEDAERAHVWCDRNPLWRPRQHTQETLCRISRAEIALTAPPQAKHVHLSRPGPGRTHIKTDSKCGDTICLSDLPLYTATTGSPTTIYFEVRIVSIGAEKKFLRSNDVDSGLAVGFVAPPYPSWRLPGWHRASLGVHGDDGRRYVDDTWGGKDFTKPFRKGDIIGIGMLFSPPQYGGGAAKREVEVLLTRNGKRDGGWKLHEERDRDQDGGDVTGLEGEHDLLAAVGCFGAVEFEVKFRKDEWIYKF